MNVPLVISECKNMNSNVSNKWQFAILTLILYVEVASCKRHKNHSNYIIGGIVVEDKKPLPYLVQLGKFRGRFFYVQHFCGGTILTPRHVLTAAHCVFGRDHRTVRIRSGTRWKDYGGYLTELAGWWCHVGPLKVFGGDGDDIAVVLTKTPIPMVNAVPVTLAKVEPPDDVIVEPAGWGADEWEERRSNVLKIVAQNMTSGKPCVGLVRFFNNDSYICTKSNYATGAYFGDSGGPLIFNTTQVGIVCTIPLKSGPRYLQIFRRVAKFRDFINNCTARLSITDP